MAVCGSKGEVIQCGHPAAGVERGEKKLTRSPEFSTRQKLKGKEQLHSEKQLAGNQHCNQECVAKFGLNENMVIVIRINAM